MKLEELKCQNNNINLEDYILLRNTVKNNMEYPDWLGDFTKEDIKAMLNNGSKIWLYYKGSIPVCSMMLIPATNKDIEKFDLDFYYQEVVDYGPSMVNPDFIGNGLQYQMVKVLDIYAYSNSVNNRNFNNGSI